MAVTWFAAAVGTNARVSDCWCVGTNRVLVRQFGVKVVLIFTPFFREEVIAMPQPFSTGCPASSAYLVLNELVRVRKQA